MVKEELITDVMRMLGLTSDDRRKFRQAQRLRLQQRLLGKTIEKEVGREIVLLLKRDL